MIVDVSHWVPDASFDDCFDMAVSLGLVELVEQRGEDCARLTQRGINAMLILTMVAGRTQKDAKQPH